MTGLGLNHQFSSTNFVKSHEKSHETKSLSWLIDSSNNFFKSLLFLLFLFGTHGDRKTSEPVFDKILPKKLGSGTAYGTFPLQDHRISTKIAKTTAELKRGHLHPI